MSVLTPLLNIGFILAIFILEGNTPVLNELLQMCVSGLDITGLYITLATISMLINIFKICIKKNSCTHFYSINNLPQQRVLNTDSFRSCILNNHRGNTPVLNELLQMCMRGLDITSMTLATISMLINIFKICRFFSCTRFYSINNIFLINRF